MIKAGEESKPAVYDSHSLCQRGTRENLLVSLSSMKTFRSREPCKRRGEELHQWHFLSIISKLGQARTLPVALGTNAMCGVLVLFILITFEQIFIVYLTLSLGEHGR